MHQPMVCAVCRANFVARNPRQITCSNRCYMRNHLHPGLSDQPRSCVQCGSRLPADAHRGAKYCGAACRAASSKRRCRQIAAAYVRHQVCGHCGASLVARKAGTRFCGEQCERRERMFPGSATYFASRRCEYCDEPIPNEARYNKRHCADRCTVLANQIIRRARRAGRPVERISRTKIFVRDNWICHICGVDVDPELTDPDPMSASLDHVIPFCHDDSPGHVEVNVALAHWKCNVVKNGRTRPEDWELHRRLVAAAALI